MTGEEFLTVLAAAMPTSGELADHGLNDEEIGLIQRAFRARPSAPFLHEPDAGSELERMILEQDCSTIAVGSIRFLRASVPHPHGTMVALDEADSLVVRGDGVIAVYDHTDPNFLILECALDSEHFLDAISAYIGILRERMTWQGRYSEAVELCMSRAGGYAYRTFCQSLCGFLSRTMR